MTAPRIAVLVLNWNGADDTLACLASLRATAHAVHSVAVVDNGSQDDSVARIRAAHPEVTLIETGANLGFAGGNNVGLRWALAEGFDVAVLLNNDTTVATDWLAQFCDAASRLPPGSVLGGKILRADAADRVWHFGARWDAEACRFEKLAQGRPEGEIDQLAEVDVIVGCCMWLPRASLEAVGLLEESYFLNYEETDWCFRARRAGIRLYSVPRARVWHKVSASFSGQAHNAYFTFRNRRLWIERQFAGVERERVEVRMALPDERKAARKRWLYRTWRALCELAGTRLPPRIAERLAICEAALAGVADYRARRFGNRTDWQIGTTAGAAER